METMKRLLLLAGVAAVLLAGYWWQANRENQQAAVTTEVTTVPTTQPPTVLPTEATEEKLLLQDAYISGKVYPSYEELFSCNREYVESYNVFSREYAERQLCSWVVMDGDTGTEYEMVQQWTDGRWVLCIYCAAQDVKMEVPAQMLLTHTLMACDGRYAYFGKKEYRDSNTYYQILRLDLVTNQTEAILWKDTVLDVYFCGDAVMYYATCQGSTIQICRMYLPEQTVDVLYSLDTVPAMFRLNRPSGTLADITWTTVSPEMLPLIEAELNNADSIYKPISDEKDTFWYAKDALYDPAWRNDIQLLATSIRVKTGIPAIETWTYRCSDGGGTVEKQPEPTLNRSESPEVVMGTWQPLPGVEIQGIPDAECKPMGDTRSVIRGSGLVPGNPWRYSDGLLIKLSEDLVVETADGEDSVYCLTEENTIVQLAWDGSVRNVLYVGGEDRLKYLLYREGFLYVLEGSEILEIDIAAAQYRVLLRQEGICVMYLTNPTKNGLYFRKDGCWAHIYWFTSEQIEETSG